MDNMKDMKIMMKNIVLLGFALAIANNVFAAGRNDNLKVLSDKDYRKPLEEIVVTGQTERRPQTDRAINVEPSSTRLQWLPQFDKNSPESLKPRSTETEEKPLIKLFEKKF